MKQTPPKWVDKFLQWYCRPDLLEEIQGDAYELFYRNAKKSKRKADLSFTWNVLRFLRWRNIRKQSNTYSTTSTAMLRSYFLSGLRAMVRNAMPSAINIIGLSVALGCAVTIFVLEDSYFNLDAMHEKGDRIALVVSHVKEGEGTEMVARSPHPLADLLRENTAVEMTARAGRTRANVRVADKVFSESILFSDPEFMDMFSFRILSGDRNCLKNKTQLMLSREMAEKYFGSKNITGQALSLKFNEKYKYEFTVGAVLEDTPANSSMYFDFLVPASVWIEMNQDKLDDWSKNLGSTFLLLKEGEQLGSLTSSLDAYRKLQNQANPVQAVRHAELMSLSVVAQESYAIAGSLSWSNHPSSMIAMVVIAVFLVLLAAFNYMNVAVASVSTRLKEIGIRKVVGGRKSEIIFQFLVENVVLCSFALLAGTVLAYYFLVPGFNALFPIKIDFEISTWKMAALFFGSLLLLVALLSGAYPALYVSSFNAVKILKGKEKFGSKSLFSKALLTFQFTLSITTMVGCLVFVWATFHFEKIDWGYNKAGTVGITLQNPEQYEEVKKEILANRNLVSFAGATRHIGKSNQPASIIMAGEEYSAKHFPVGFQYLETMNIRLKSGRVFDESIEADRKESAIVNEALVRKMGWTSPLGTEFLCDSVRRYVIGVVEDFYFNDFYNAVEPVVFTIAPNDRFNFVVVKARAGSVSTLAGDLKSIWKKIAPDDPHQVFVQSEVFDNFIQNNRANNKVIFFIAGVAVLLAAMGLYGLVSYNLTRRLREFSVRKVFGAGIPEIFRLMNRDYLWIVLIAFGAGAPLGALLMGSLIKSIYPYDIPVTWWPYVISILVMVMMVALTITSQLKRVIHENPTETLRSE